MKLIVLLFTIFFTSIVHATHWPSFIAPDKQFLVQHNLLETQNCPLGKGKLASNILINISKELCKNFCPGVWNWISLSDERCHSLDTDFQFKGYEFFYYRSPSDQTINFSVIVAAYGSVDSPEPFHKFIFMSLPGDYWQCHEQNKNTALIICANDV